MGKPIRVLVVDDSAFMRRVLSDMLEEDPQIEVVATCVDGSEALRKVKALRPDVVTMDIKMPHMDGFTALGLIMEQCPTPVLMVTGLGKEDADIVLRAFEFGAVDFVLKPSGTVSLDMAKVKAELIEKVKIAAGIDLRSLPQARAELPTIPPVDARGFRVIAMGASTGGPQAIMAILREIPQGLPLAILIVQHMPPNFTRSFAERLSKACGLQAREAGEGDLVEPGVVLVAPGDWHMEVRPVSENSPLLKVHLHQEPRVHGVRPSIDVLLASIANHARDRGVGVILTGMGRDGAAGMAKLQSSSGTTIVQDEATCTVFGMPKAALETITPDRVLPLNEIARTLTGLA